MIEFHADFGKVNEWIKKMAEKAKRNPVAWKQIAIEARADVMRHFLESQGPRGTWAPLKYRIGMPLMKSGMRGGLYGTLQGKGLDDCAIVSSGKVYAAVHNWGYEPRNIPQRQFLWFSKEAMNRFAKIYGSEVVAV